MFSFRELVESMEDKKRENVPPVMRSARSPSGTFTGVPMECERQGKRKSQCKIKISDCVAEEYGRHEVLWEYNKSQEDQGQGREGFQEVVAAQARKVEGQGARTGMTNTEPPKIIHNEEDTLCTSILKRPNYSLQDLCYSIDRNDSKVQKVPPSPNMMYQNALLDQCQLSDTLKASLLHEKDSYLMVQNSKSQSINDINQEEQTQRPSNICSTGNWIVSRSGDYFQDSIPKDLHFHETNKSSHYNKMHNYGTPLKETTLTGNLERQNTRKEARGPDSNCLGYCVPSASQGTASAMQLVINNINNHSDDHWTTSSSSHQPKDMNDCKSHCLHDNKASHVCGSSSNFSKQGARGDDMRRDTSTKSDSHTSELATNVISLQSSKNTAIKTTQPGHTLRNPMKNFGNKKFMKLKRDRKIEFNQNVKIRLKINRRGKTRGNMLATHCEKANTVFDQEPVPPQSLGFRCHPCSSWWPDADSLARHQRLHAPARPYACPECPSRFNQLVHLQIHQRMHTGEKPFCCCVCNASFSRKDRLRSHEQRHSGKLPYTCPYCSASFRDAASLRNHVSGHARQPPFTCRLCNATFVHLSTFTSHWRIHN